MKLKKEVKVVLLHFAIISTLILLVVGLAKYDKNAYRDCMIKNNNNANLCSELLR